jgi:hypothetical protein
MIDNIIGGSTQHVLKKMQGRMRFAWDVKGCVRLIWEATLRTSPSSGQAAIRSLLRRPKLLACHSRPALDGQTRAANG